MLNLDTHILLFALADQLTARERKLLRGDAWSISAIVLWEVAKLSRIGRIKLNLDSAEFRRSVSKVHCWPIDLAVCREIPKLDFSGDPADEIIAATSIVNQIPLVTRDRKLRDSRLTPLA